MRQISDTQMYRYMWRGKKIERERTSERERETDAEMKTRKTERVRRRNA